jgi:hypothetical protein
LGGHLGQCLLAPHKILPIVLGAAEVIHRLNDGLGWLGGLLQYPPCAFHGWPLLLVWVELVADHDVEVG